MSDISVVGVVGAGQMGNGIAHVAAAAGFQVHLTDVSQAAIDKAKVTIETIANDRAVTYRARLHGLNERQAHDLCRRIKSAQFDCLTIALAVAKDHG